MHEMIKEDKRNAREVLIKNMRKYTRLEMLEGITISFFIIVLMYYLGKIIAFWAGMENAI